MMDRGGHHMMDRVHCMMDRLYYVVDYFGKKLTDKVLFTTAMQSQGTVIPKSGRH